MESDKSDTPLSRLQLFIADKLSDEDQTTFGSLLQEFIEDMPGEQQQPLAADALRRQIAARRRMAGERDFVTRFPGAANSRLLG